MVLCDDFHGKVVLFYLYVGIGSHCGHQSALYLRSGIVCVVQDAKLRVSTLTVQVIGAVVFLVKVHAPAHQFFYLGRRIAHHLLNSSAVADVVARYHGVFNVLLEVVYK